MSECSAASSSSSQDSMALVQQTPQQSFPMDIDSESALTESKTAFMDLTKALDLYPQREAPRHNADPFMSYKKLFYESNFTLVRSLPLNCLILSFVQNSNATYMFCPSAVQL